MHYAALASGSKGNCHALTDGDRTLLIDAGISLRQIRQRLDGLGLQGGEVRALALTHEHSDHVGALGVILRRTTWAILATPAQAEIGKLLAKKLPEQWERRAGDPPGGGVGPGRPDSH